MSEEQELAAMKIKRVEQLSGEELVKLLQNPEIW